MAFRLRYENLLNPSQNMASIEKTIFGIKQLMVSNQKRFVGTQLSSSPNIFVAGPS